MRFRPSSLNEYLETLIELGIDILPTAKAEGFLGIKR